jgi:hypothetical protein
MASLDPNDTLLTPREIKMMGHLVNVSPEPKAAWAAYFAYTLCKHHVPHYAKEAFESRFKVAIPSPLATNSSDYLLNESNMPAAIALNSHLQVRKNRLQTKDAKALDIGLGGLVIEGEPGEGKSQLIVTQLVAHGYKKDTDFIYIPAKSKPDEVKQKLLAGFHQGLIVVIDEMNSLPLPEQLLNALLEGHDLDDQLPKKPGFLLLGTQNPTTYHGRLKTTAPLEHRLQKVILPKSTLLEKEQVLTTMGVPLRIAQGIIAEYAKHPDLTFRDVMRTARQWLKKNKEHLPSHEKEISQIYKAALQAILEQNTEENDKENKAPGNCI